MTSSSVEKSYKFKIVWRNVIVVCIYHYLAVQGLFYLLSLTTKWQTIVWGLFMGILTIIGATAGSHRLWSHSTYKAKLPLQIFLCILQTISFQNSIYEWARDHRVHHKFTDTDADPHNANRGFFFSHMGWLMVHKHPEVFNKGKTVDMSDIENNPVVRFQKKYYSILAPLVSLVLPTMVPCYFWNEDAYVAFAGSGMLRYVLGLHFTWSVNSVAHMWGTQPYERNIKPADNKIVSFVTQGEGWHNYHHVFPWDYRAGELDKYNGNLTTSFIDLMAKFGLAYDLKTAPKKLIQMKRDKVSINNNTANK